MAVTHSTPALWVDDQKLFEKALGDLRAANRIGVDTESNSLHAYEEQVCLIQFTDEKADYLVDPLSGIDLSSLNYIFSNQKIEKIFHAAEYDIMCLKRDFGFKFNNLFDTMQAARILGMEKLGLSSLLSDLFGIDQGKSFQKANWGKRPLNEEMRHYARLDTHYLLSLRENLAERLAQKRLMDLAQEDFQRLCRVEPNHRESRLFMQISGYHLVDPQTLSILDELCKFRDRTAKKMDRPHFKVIGNSALLALAQAQPVTPSDLEKVVGVSPRVTARYKKEILEAVHKGASQAPILLEKRRRPSQAYIARLDALHQWRKNAGKKMGVQSDIILPRETMEVVAADHPRDMEELHALMADLPWRFEVFGDEIIKVIDKGKRS